VFAVHPDTARDLSTRTALAACAAAVLVGAALRAPGLASDLWLDEIWPWWISQRLTSALDVFTSIHHSANHHALMLWFYAVGDAPAWLLRLPSFLGGCAGVALAARLAWRRGRLEAVLAAWLYALCFGLVFYSSEGRGYAAMLACVLAAQWALESAFERPRAKAFVGFGAALAIALIFQPIAIFYWAGAAAQSLWVWRRARWPHLVRRLLALHALPAAVLTLLWIVDLRAMIVGSGDPVYPRRLTADVLSAFGFLAKPSLLWPYIAIALAVVARGLALRWRSRDGFWLGAPLAIFVAPAAVILATRPEVIAVRYFVIGIAFALLLAADAAADAWRARGWRRAAAVFLLAGFAVGNAVQLVQFAQFGRGGYRATVHAIAEQAPGARSLVGGDHDFRTGQVVAYYARELPPGTQVVYVPRDRWPAGGPEWWISHSAWTPRVTPQRIVVARRGYRLFAAYPHAGFSGFYWALYRKEPAPAAP
jgi:hypothetical protein